MYIYTRTYIDIYTHTYNRITTIIKKDPHNMMPPPPYFTVRMAFGGEQVVLGLPPC